MSIPSSINNERHANIVVYGSIAVVILYELFRHFSKYNYAGIEVLGFSGYGPLLILVETASNLAGIYVISHFYLHKRRPFINFAYGFIFIKILSEAYAGWKGYAISLLLPCILGFAVHDGVGKRKSLIASTLLVGAFAANYFLGLLFRNIDITTVGQNDGSIENHSLALAFIYHLLARMTGSEGLIQVADLSVGDFPASLSPMNFAAYFTREVLNIPYEAFTAQSPGYITTIAVFFGYYGILVGPLFAILLFKSIERFRICRKLFCDIMYYYVGIQLFAFFVSGDVYNLVSRIFILTLMGWILSRSIVVKS